MGKRKAAPAPRTTPEARAAYLKANPQHDRRPRYRDGTPAMSDDRVDHGGREARLLWTNLVAEVPRCVWDGVLDGMGTVPLNDLRLISRRNA